jgi:hypothetical protein
MELDTTVSKMAKDHFLDKAVETPLHVC